MRTINRVRAGAVIVAGVLALSACAGSSSKSGGGSSSSSTGAGSSSSTSAANNSKPTLEIGVQGPLSGSNQALGLNIDWGVKLAIQEANAKGDLPFNLSIKESDDQGDQSHGATAAQLLIQDSKVLGVVGPAFSGPSAAAGSLYSSANLVAISPSATNPKLTASGFKTFYRVVANDNIQGKAAADYMVKGLKATNVYVVDDKTQYGQGLSTAIVAELKQDGATVETDSAPQGTQDYSQLASKVAGSGAKAMYYAGYYADGGVFAKALKAAGFGGTMVSGDGSKDPNFVTTAGKDAAEGWQFTCACLDTGTDAKYAQFVTDYKKLANAAPGTYSIEGYDAANTIISVLKSLNTASPTRQQVADAVGKVDYQGLSKEVKFTPSGDISGTSVYAYKITGGVITLIGDISKMPGIGS
ncbi:Extracellular ligand-binding receptor [Catenulispora acidiphila DSM 44928]|uniref:Extracellular ligand-binding receptor n=1 Tax=Catenulispora acidiphila (strain DSM 44928 / JCM 14897 / NBRC 102108 / NRRL B-24433 / ID139908) TaxID=479433 RepID=C7QC96_CATAD|nr:branched-chain amino acid ABC transporter substrate-binding protein [Catenulispora acidiphila]ACU74544.1 Extracellular ligand-binding receptor [Catenulispora acidiphila DSM 44928]